MPIKKNKLYQYIFLLIITLMVIFNGGNNNLYIQFNFIIVSIFFLLFIREKNYLNTASALIKQSIQEMEIFVEHLKGKKETVKGLAGLGDLYVSSGGGLSLIHI